VYVQNIDVNYYDVTQARKTFFTAQGLTEQTHYIASTGIEGRTAYPEIFVLLDAYAVGGLQKGQQRYLYALSHFCPTYKYGVTFERGVVVEYGDRSHIFISGTASIDNKGDVVHPGDVENQTYHMLDNIAALLEEAGSGFDDICCLIVYLRDIADYPVVNNIFEKRFKTIPKVLTWAPVCRPGWLVEAECIAIKKNNNSAYADL
jgi:enamine deaminase RidA (YjgF/YER057c/UK114 family)